MRLVRETQCEVEVVKPVLDELEVLRLCRSFGVMSSVNPKDFEFGVLQAGEFDEDVIPFLRNGLFGEANNSKVKFKAVFGKQNEVASALVAMGACSAETAASLKKPSKGSTAPRFKVAAVSRLELSKKTSLDSSSSRGSKTNYLNRKHSATLLRLCCGSSPSWRQTSCAAHRSRTW